jgi:cytoplasmic iron level regulating protein YaaA (DUF328/UPF0246 family)
MLILTSPAKTLDYEHPYQVPFNSQPTFLKEAEELMKVLRTKSEKELMDILEVSKDLAHLNHERFQVWKADHTLDNSRPAIVAYQGDIYEQIHEKEYSEQQSNYLQDSLRIISGLYGLVRPYDLIQPYRLEMKAALATQKGADLYAFWGEKLTAFLKKEIEEKSHPTVVNLASGEYAKAIHFEMLGVPVVNIIFHQIKDGKTVNIGLLAKKARGQMIDFMVKNQIYDVNQLETFDVDGYTFSAKTPTELLFVKQLTPGLY